MEQRIEMRGGGSLTFRQEGTKLQLEAERPEDGRGHFLSGTEQIWKNQEKFF